MRAEECRENTEVERTGKGSLNCMYECLRLILAVQMGVIDLICKTQALATKLKFETVPTNGKTELEM